MNKRQYIQQNLQRLRRVDGDTATLFNGEGKDIKAGLGLEYGLSITNNSKSAAASVAILPGHYRNLINPSVSIETETGTASDGNNGTVTAVTSAALSEMAVVTAAEQLSLAGIPCSCVADEFAEEQTDGDIVVTPHDPSSPVFSFLEYLRTNPMALRGLQVNCDSKSVLNTSSLVVSSSSPFMRNATKKINLSSFFSAHQYQDDMVQIDLSGNELELSDITVLVVNIPAGATMSFLMKF